MHQVAAELSWVYMNNKMNKFDKEAEWKEFEKLVIRMEKWLAPSGATTHARWLLCYLVPMRRPPQPGITTASLMY